MANTNSNTPHSKKVRAAAANRRKERIVAAGGRSIGPLLSPEAASAMDKIQAATDEKISPLICRLLIEEAKKF